MAKRKEYLSTEEYFLYPLADEDRENYVELHRQINGNGTLFLNPVTKDTMWEQALDDVDKSFSIYTVNGGYCGNIELQNSSSTTPEIGIDLMQSARNRGITPKIIPLFAKKISEEYNVDYFLIRISSKNEHSKHVFEKMGAVLIGKEDTVFQKFISKYSELVSATDDNGETLKKYFDEDSDEFVWKYKLDVKLFS
jgi:RimJ/RimL family protein N-acetyltransferase